MIAIIGGSGFEKFDGFERLADLPRETPFGLASSGLRRVRVAGHEALFVSRHGSHHELTPTEVNYRANIFALKNAGAKMILSFSAVGSLDRALAPGSLVVPHQYIDRTKGLRKHSFSGEGFVAHVSLAKPTCTHLEAEILKLSSKYDFGTHFKKTYVCVEGPYFSTKAESLSFRQMGAQIIGMSNFPEYALAREAGLPYLPCCFVTDYDCWDDSIPHVTLEHVIEVMRKNNAKAFQIVCDLLNQGADPLAQCDCAGQGLRSGLMTPMEAVPKEKQAWLKTLLNS